MLPGNGCRFDGMNPARRDLDDEVINCLIIVGQPMVFSVVRHRHLCGQNVNLIRVNNLVVILK